MALMLTGHFRKSTPETGLDVIMVATPLDLHITATALKARIRTKGKFDPKWEGKEPRGKMSHFRKLDIMLEEAGFFGESGFRYVNGRQEEIKLVR